MMNDLYYSPTAERVGVAVGVIAFLASWIACTISYGYLWGFGVGWLPSLILGMVLYLVSGITTLLIIKFHAEIFLAAITIAGIFVYINEVEERHKKEAQTQAEQVRQQEEQTKLNEIREAVQRRKHPDWLDKQQAWGIYLGGGTYLAISTSGCEVTQLRNVYPYSAILEYPTNGYPNPTQHTKQIACWKWDGGLVRYSYSENNSFVANTRSFTNEWNEFTEEWYKKDWPKNND